VKKSYDLVQKAIKAGDDAMFVGLLDQFGGILYLTPPKWGKKLTNLLT
jgi:hypothetical protein